MPGWSRPAVLRYLAAIAAVIPAMAARLALDPTQGSEFVVRLPVLPPAQAPPVPEEERGRQPDGKPPCCRILVVDDNIDAAKSLGMLVSLYGQEVRVANDGPEALIAAAEFLPEVVLLDIGMLGTDGNQVVRHLRERPELEKTLMVALTGWGHESDVERSRSAGFDHHLVKPADPGAILELLTRARAKIRLDL